MTNPGSVEELDRKRQPPSTHQAVIDSGRNFLRPDWAGEQIGVWWLFNIYQRAGRMFSTFGQSGPERGESCWLWTITSWWCHYTIRSAFPVIFNLDLCLYLNSFVKFPFSFSFFDVKFEYLYFLLIVSILVSNPGGRGMAGCKGWIFLIWLADWLRDVVCCLIPPWRGRVCHLIISTQKWPDVLWQEVWLARAGSRGNISLAGLHRKLAQGKWVGGTGEQTEPGNITDLLTL